MAESETIAPPTFRVADNPGYHSTGIPWAMIAPHEGQALRNHSQTLRRLHERGGLVWSEALAVLNDRDWQHNSNAKTIVLKMVDAWKETNNAR